MLKELDQYDWAEAFAYAGEKATDESYYGMYGQADVRTHPGSGVETKSFGREDVEFIAFLSEGENDGPSWLCAGRLKDGRYFALEAGCDYTGWDCQAGGSAHVAASLAEAIELGFSDHDRSRLGWEG